MEKVGMQRQEGEKILLRVRRGGKKNRCETYPLRNNTKWLRNPNIFFTLWNPIILHLRIFCYLTSEWASSGYSACSRDHNLANQFDKL